MQSQLTIAIEDIDRAPNAKLLRFTGDLDATNVEDTLSKIMGFFENGTIFLIADFTNLRYVNSTGLGILLHFAKVAKDKNGCFKITNINENVYEIIEIIGATPLLDIYDDVTEAIKALA